MLAGKVLGIVTKANLGELFPLTSISPEIIRKHAFLVISKKMEIE